MAAENGAVHLPGVIAEQFGISRSEARRLIDQGAVTLGGEAARGRRARRALRARRRGGPGVGGAASGACASSSAAARGALYSPVGPQAPLGAGS